MHSGDGNSVAQHDAIAWFADHEPFLSDDEIAGESDRIERLEAFDSLLAMGERGDFDRAAEAHAAGRRARRQ